ncbi:MAG: CsgG/HfaB family protein [Fimbriimonadaceae bacterium]
MKRSYTALASALALSVAVVSGARPPAAGSQQADSKADDQYKIKLNLPPYTGPKKRLGVMDLEVKVTATAATNPTPQGGTTTVQTIDVPQSTDFGTGLTEMLTTALVDSNRFLVLERKALPDIQTEQALSASPSADPNAALKPASILSAQALIRGAVTEFSYKSSSTGGSGILGNVLGVSHTASEATVVLDIRIYDASTSVILDSVKGVGKVKASGTSANLNVYNVNLGASNFQSSPLGEATRRAIADCVRQICQRMAKIPWEARVADLEADGQTLYINAGSAMGIKQGDEFDIYHPGRDIIDPDTKVVIGRTKDTKCGHVKVDTVTAGLSIAKVVDGSGFAKSDVVRFSKS